MKFEINPKLGCKEYKFVKNDLFDEYTYSENEVEEKWDNSFK